MLIGITGGIGSGKSTICRALAEKGYYVYDSDSRAKEIITNNRPVRSQIECLFGSEVFEDDTYRTEWVAKRVFEDKTLLERLNAIVHPAVCRDVTRWHKDIVRRAATLAEETGIITAEPVCFVESAILYESGLADICDRVVYVDAPERVRIERTMKRDGSDMEAVRARVRQQKTSDAKLKSDIALLNDGTVPIQNLLDGLERHIQAFYTMC